MKWVTRAQDIIEQSLQVQTIRFRSPLEIPRRKLQYLLRHRNQPFFDTQRGLPKTVIANSFLRFRSEDILLLYVAHRKFYQSFFEGLEFFLTNAQQAGFTFKAIPGNIIPSLETSYLCTSTLRGNQGKNMLVVC